MSRFLVITASADFERRIRAAVDHDRPGQVQILGVAAAATGPQEILRRTPDPVDVLVLGPDVDLERAFALATIFDRQHPDTAVVLAAEPAPEIVLPAMRAGIRDLVAPQAEPEQLRVLLERAAGTAESRRRSPAGNGGEVRRRGRVIPVMSPKGGVGKTTVATNLAVGLAKAAPMGVVIVDLDLQFGDVASGLNLVPDHTISDAVFGTAAQDTMVLKAFLSAHPSGAYALCAPRHPADADLIKPVHITTLINQLSLEFQYVVVDTSPGVGEHLLAVLEQATDGVWVCGMDVPSIRGLRSGLEVLRELDLMPPSRTIVLNFADKRSGLTVLDVESTIGLPVDVVLPRSRSLPFSTNKGVPVLQDNVRDAAAKGLRKLVASFAPDPAAEAGKKLQEKVVTA